MEFFKFDLGTLSFIVENVIYHRSPQAKRIARELSEELNKKLFRATIRGCVPRIRSHLRSEKHSERFRHHRPRIAC
jgi:hypothetical protein